MLRSKIELYFLNLYYAKRFSQHTTGEHVTPPKHNSECKRQTFDSRLNKPMFKILCAVRGFLSHFNNFLIVFIPLALNDSQPLSLSDRDTVSQNDSS